MNCKNCQNDLTSTTHFCPNCGQKVIEESLSSIASAIAALETKIKALDHENAAKEQKYLEVETAENIIGRVMKWAKMFGFFVGFPLIVLAAITGISVNDLRNVALKAQESIEPIISKAKKDAEEAKTNASLAREQSSMVEKEVKETSGRLESLRSRTRDSEDKLNQLDDSIKKRNTEVAALGAKSDIQTKEIQVLKDQIKRASYNKNEHLVTDVYPVLAGIQRVQSADGQIIDANNKARDETYVSLNVSFIGIPHPKTGTNQIVRALGTLSGWKYKTFFGDISLFPDLNKEQSGPTATIGAQFCEARRIPLPCIVYFDQRKAFAAHQTAHDLDNIWFFSEEHIRYVNPVDLEVNVQKLIQKSGLDMLIIFGH